MRNCDMLLKNVLMQKFGILISFIVFHVSLRFAEKHYRLGLFVTVFVQCCVNNFHIWLFSAPTYDLREERLEIKNAVDKIRSVCFFELP